MDLTGDFRDSGNQHDQDDLQDDDINSDQTETTNETDKIRINGKAAILRAKTLAMASSTLLDAKLPNEISIDQVSVTTKFIGGICKYDIKICCSLCGLSITIATVGAVKGSVSNSNFKRHLIRKHNQGKDSTQENRAQPKILRFFRNNDKNADLNDDDGQNDSNEPTSSTDFSQQGSRYNTDSF